MNACLTTIRAICDVTQHRRPLGRRAAWLMVAACLAVALPLAAMRAADSAEKTEPEAEAVSPQTQRARELIYLFRQHRVFGRDEEWARTIRELVDIGKPAVPELVAELDRTERNSTLRSLGFTLRAIGDPRAVPALIRAIPKTRLPGGSDCGVIIVDANLRDFMKQNQNYQDQEATALVACGRPVNEILSALEKLTDHPEPYIAGGNDDRADLWLTWWKHHEQDFPIDDEMRAIAKRPRDDDPVEAAGVARFGPLFPTGPKWKLGPIHEVVLDPDFYFNGKSHIDFDTGRVFGQHEGLEHADQIKSEDFGIAYFNWSRKSSIDARLNAMVEGRDLDVWLVDNDRWDTLENELETAEPLSLGQEATSYLVPFENGRTDFKYDRIGTFLFTTREGGRGIVQVDPREGKSYSRRLRYRMFVSSDARPVDPTPAESRPPVKTRFGKPVTVTLPIAKSGAECLLDLESGRKYVLPADFKIKDDTTIHTLFQDKDSADWCRERGIDVVGYAAAFESETFEDTGATAKLAGQDGELNTFPTLLGREMTAVRILPKSFYTLSVEEVQEILSRTFDRQQDLAWMSSDPRSPETAESFAIRTSDGTIGLITLEHTPQAPDKITIRYRLHVANRK